MADALPQTRAIDPFASYYSDQVNKLTRSVTQGRDCLHFTNTINVYMDTTSPTDFVIVSKGQCYKDDVIIELTEDYRVDLTDEDFYVSMGELNQAGFYYLCLEYDYVRSKPPPTAHIRILKPPERGGYLPQIGSYLLLKVLYVIADGGGFSLQSLFDYDPQNTNKHREYIRTYIGAEYTLPDFDQERDEGRFVYTLDTDKLYHGFDTGWSEMARGIDIDFINAFIGKTSRDSETPNYISTNHITQHSHLESAIGRLDSRLAFSSRTKTADVGDETPSVMDEYGKHVGILTIPDPLLSDSTAHLIITNLSDATSVMSLLLLFETSNITLQNNNDLQLSENQDYYGDTRKGILMYYNGDHWIDVSTTTSPDREVIINSFHTDSIMNGVEEANVWNMSPSIRFSPFTNGAVWGTFRYKNNWNLSKPVKIKLLYAMSAQDDGYVSINASFWVVANGEFPTQALPTYGPEEDVLLPYSVNVMKEDILTDIEIPSSYFTSKDCIIIVKLWRDVLGVENNHIGWLELVEFIAFQSVI